MLHPISGVCRPAQRRTANFDVILCLFVFIDVIQTTFCVFFDHKAVVICTSFVRSKNRTLATRPRLQPKRSLTIMYEISFVDDDQEDFRIQELLGEGSFAQVYRCVETKSQTVFALKEFYTRHKEYDESAVQREIEVWSDVIHENIVRLYASFTTGSYLYFVLEFVDGGSLFNHMMQRQKYSEKDAANIMKQVRLSD